MGGPLGLGWKWGCLCWFPSLTADGVVVLGSYLYNFVDATHTPLPAKGPVCDQPASRCYHFLGSPFTLQDTAIVFSFRDVSGS